MPAKKRHKTQYPGVFWYEVTDATGKPDKVFYIRFRKDGKSIDEKVGRASQRMTAAKANQIRGQRASGKQPTNTERRAKERAKRERMTMMRLWERFKEAKAKNKSIREDEYRWGKHLVPAFGSKMPHELVTLDIDRLRHKLEKLGLAPATVKQYMVQVKRIINFGVRKGLCPAPDPSRLNFEMPKLNNEKTEDLDADQLQALLAAIDADDNKQVGNLMLMALYTGMRRGELFRLKWEDIDTERGFINIRDPKGGKDARIPLNQAARDLLERHERTGSPYVFPGRDGAQRTDCRHQVARIKARAGLPRDFRPLHGLRHAYASMLASSGKVDIYTLQKLLTHKSAAMTARYAHLRDEALQRAGEVAGELFTGEQGKRRKVVNIK